jgi:hypothetical protein
MAIKTLVWQIPATQLKNFDRGKVISTAVPAYWGLKTGDRLEYECGMNISGMAEVVGVSPEEVRTPDWNGMESGEEGPPMVAGQLCEFRRLN